MCAFTTFRKKKEKGTFVVVSGQKDRKVKEFKATFCIIWI